MKRRCRWWGHSWDMASPVLLNSRAAHTIYVWRFRCRRCGDVLHRADPQLIDPEPTAVFNVPMEP